LPTPPLPATVKILVSAIVPMSLFIDIFVSTLSFYNYLLLFIVFSRN